MGIPVYDNTRLSSFKRCPRAFYFRHVRHWTAGEEGSVSPPLVFGASWHAAMDAVWPLLCGGTNMSTEEIQEEGIKGFLQEWTSQGMPEEIEAGSQMEDKLKGMRTPGVAREMLYHYVESRRDYLADVELLAVEQPFVVPIHSPYSGAVYHYCGKLDKVYKKGGQITVGEHKTSSLYSTTQGFRSSFLESFFPNAQIDGYAYALSTLYPDAVIPRVMVDAALVHKVHHNIFTFKEVVKSKEHLREWAMDTIQYIINVEENKRSTARRSEGEGPLDSFPHNTNSCHDTYGACSYLEICRFMGNPEDIENPPPGMRVEEWNPVEALGASLPSENTNV